MKRKVIVRCLFLIPIAIGCFYSLWLLLRVFIFDVFLIPSDSMLPTLQPGFSEQNTVGSKNLYRFPF